MQTWEELLTTGRGVGEYGSCNLAYNKKAGLWTFNATLTKRPAIKKSVTAKHYRKFFKNISPALYLNGQKLSRLNFTRESSDLMVGNGMAVKCPALSALGLMI